MPDIFSDGYNYKHTPTNAAFINLGARLYAYTGNETYAEWTVKVGGLAQDLHVGLRLILICVACSRYGIGSTRWV